MKKTVYAVFDKQKELAKEKIVSAVDYVYEAQEHGLENVVLNGIDIEVLRRYGKHLIECGEWPCHLSECAPNNDMSEDEVRDALFQFFKKKKGEGALAALVSFCTEDEMPAFIRETIYEISQTIYPPKCTAEANTAIAAKSAEYSEG